MSVHSYIECFLYVVYVNNYLELLTHNLPSITCRYSWNQNTRNSNKITNQQPPSETRDIHYIEAVSQVKEECKTIQLIIDYVERHSGTSGLKCNTKNDVDDNISRPDFVGVPAKDGDKEVSQQFGGLSLGGETPMEGKARWERGEPDYLGRDSFANIQAYIDAKIKSNEK